MGIIQRQAIRSTIVIISGYVIGAFNLLILAPRFLTATELGLTRILTEVGTILATMCTLGSIPIIYKFFPFYKTRLTSEKNDLPFITLAVCMIGFVLMCTLGYAGKDLIVRKFSERSPLFVEYSYLVYPFSFFMLLFIWMESFAWSFKKGVLSNTLKETIPRFFFTLMLLLLGIKLVTAHAFLLLFSLLYLPPAMMMFYYLRKTNDFRFNTRISPVTYRFKNKMLNFGLFIFGAQFLNLLSRTSDSIILTAKSSGGLTDTAVFSIATYVITLMEVPQRSMTSITVPVLAESWKNKDMKNIRHIYTKSVTNLLIIGLIIFSIVLLNIHNLARYLGKDYTGITEVVILMGVGKMIDLGTGANSQIISTSNYWKLDFTTNVIYTLLSLPLNFLLISHYNLMGAAYATVIALTFYNVMRFAFLWYKFGLQPYTFKDLLIIVIGVAATVITFFIPRLDNLFVDTALRCLVFSILFFPLLYVAKISEEVNALVLKYAHVIRDATINRKNR
jgi:O-antigen/teichoic acid export membrane protein